MTTMMMTIIMDVRSYRDALEATRSGAAAMITVPTTTVPMIMVAMTMVTMTEIERDGFWRGLAR